MEPARPSRGGCVPRRAQVRGQPGPLGAGSLSGWHDSCSARCSQPRRAPPGPGTPDVQGPASGSAPWRAAWPAGKRGLFGAYPPGKGGAEVKTDIWPDDTSMLEMSGWLAELRDDGDGEGQAGRQAAPSDTRGSQPE